MRHIGPRLEPYHPWTREETDRLADLIAEGWTFGGAGRALGRSPGACIGRWHRAVTPALGWQAA